MDPHIAEHLTPVYIVRVVALVAWLVLLALAYRRRKRTYDDVGAVGGLLYIAAAERLWRVGVKVVWWCALLSITIGRVVIEDIYTERTLADAMYVIVALCGIALLAIDDVAAQAMRRWDHRHPQSKNGQ